MCRFGGSRDGAHLFEADMSLVLWAGYVPERKGTGSPAGTEENPSLYNKITDGK